ncbi:esterase/lipase family protein [Streptomyces sp. NPDC058612]|uniref:esterase/lipase family protein n=1 Tax=Streptomyces sp. NPDC058612 TaxID=3346555 RepID=UPI0036490DFD
MAAHGYCVFALDYGRLSVLGPWGIASIADSARQLAVFVRGVVAATGASQVDMVGYSLGGVMPRHYLEFEGGASKVGAFVGVSPTNHGTTSAGLDNLIKSVGQAFPVTRASAPGCFDQLAGSEFMTRLNGDGDTVPGPRYTTLITKYDMVSTPYQSQFLQGANVENLVLQNLCSVNLANHNTTHTDPVAIRVVLNALDPANAVRADCLSATRLLP